MAEADFLDAFADGELDLGGTDASVAAAAERLTITMIATVDHHFRIVRPQHVTAFHLIP